MPLYVFGVAVARGTKFWTSPPVHGVSGRPSALAIAAVSVSGQYSRTKAYPCLVTSCLRECDIGLLGTPMDVSVAAEFAKRADLPKCVARSQMKNSFSISSLDDHLSSGAPCRAYGAGHAADYSEV
jgi:hypothetical protein